MKSFRKGLLYSAAAFLLVGLTLFFCGTAAGGFGAGSGIQAGSAARPAQAAGAVYKPGDIVEHKVFGRGQVLKTTPVAGDTIVEIRFEKAGVKKTMANYAPLKKVQG